MGKVKGKHRLDKYYRFSKEQGYRARSAYKLIQLADQYNFLHSARSVLDLCAAPGSWMQVSVQRAPVGSFILGVDLVPIRPMRGALSVKEDITTQKCRASIKKMMGENGCRAFDVVLHDGSPNVGGRYTQEATVQSCLVVDAIKLATEFLVPKGTLVTKVFRSQDFNAIKFCLKKLFEKVEVTKPLASRSTSAEIYVVAQKYKAPAKIDPRLLDVRHLFQGSIEPQEVADVFGGAKRKRPPHGYEEGNTTLRKVCVASEFVWSNSPLDILGSVTSISFNNPESLPIKDHSLTTEEVKTLCEDLGVLGKKELKHLISWRSKIRKALFPTIHPSTTKAEEEIDDKHPTANAEEENDNKILNEMEELQYAIERSRKREKKRLADRQAKGKLRKAKRMQIDAVGDDYIDHELFSLSSIKGKKELEVVDSMELSDDDLRDSDSDSDSETLNSSASDSENEHRSYDEKLEEFLDQAYDRFVCKRDGSTMQRKRARMAYSHDSDSKEMLEVDEDDFVSDHESDDGLVHSEANPLIIPLHHKELPSQEQMATDWFKQDIFVGSIAEKNLGKTESDDEIEDMQEKKSRISRKKEEAPVHHLKNIDFEIVSAPETDSSDGSSSESEAEILAYVKKMPRKKQQEQIVDEAYNKYMFDNEGAPAWFLEEEKRHREPIRPVTKEEIAAIKAQLKEIDARPAKKVAQAKARKKREAMRKLEKVRRKANSISDQTDISDKSKSRMIDQLYKEATPKRSKKEYVVAKRGILVKGGKGKINVDARMKKDSRTRGIGMKLGINLKNLKHKRVG